MDTNTKPAYIIDSSALMAHLLHEPISNNKIAQAIQSFYVRSTKFIAPSILPYEVGNVLKTCVKSKRITLSEGKKLYNHFLKLPIQYTAINFNTVFSECMRSDLTYYDAAYLTLHKATSYPLLTLDKKLLSLSK